MLGEIPIITFYSSEKNGQFQPLRRPFCVEENHNLWRLQTRQTFERRSHFLHHFNSHITSESNLASHATWGYDTARGGLRAGAPHGAYGADDPREAGMEKMKCWKPDLTFFRWRRRGVYTEDNFDQWVEWAPPHSIADHQVIVMPISSA